MKKALIILWVLCLAISSQIKAEESTQKKDYDILKQAMSKCIKEQNVVFYGLNNQNSAKLEEKILSSFYQDITFIDCKTPANKKICEEKKTILANKYKLNNNQKAILHTFWSVNGAEVSSWGPWDLQSLIFGTSCNKKLMQDFSLSKEEYKAFEKTLLPKKFRDSQWEDSIEEVKKVEKATLVSESLNSLIYSDVLFGEKVQIVYIFINGKLGRAKYFFNDIYSNDLHYLPFVRKIAETYIEKYGKANSYKDVFYKENGCPFDTIGECVSFGYSKMFAKWDDKIDTDILLTWEGRTGASTVSIQYSYIALENVEDEQTKQDILQKI